MLSTNCSCAVPSQSGNCRLFQQVAALVPSGRRIESNLSDVEHYSLASPGITSGLFLPKPSECPNGRSAIFFSGSERNMSTSEPFIRFDLHTSILHCRIDAEQKRLEVYRIGERIAKVTMEEGFPARIRSEERENLGRHNIHALVYLNNRHYMGCWSVRTKEGLTDPELINELLFSLAGHVQPSFNVLPVTESTPIEAPEQPSCIIT